MPVPSPEKALTYLLRFWIVAFSGATVVFFLFEADLIRHLNRLSERLLPALPLMPVPQAPSFWLPLVGSLMVTLIVICYWVQKDVVSRVPGVHALLVSKFLSSFLFFLLFAFKGGYMAYLVATVVDGSIFLATYYFLWRMRNAGTRTSG